MKKIVLTGLLFSFIVSMLAAQESTKSFRFGLMGTPDIAWIKSNTDFHLPNGAKLGLGYGLTAEFALSDNYSFSTGLESVYTGGKMKWDSALSASKKIYEIESKYKLQFLEIPLTLKMKTNEINYFTYFARFGGSIGTRLQSRADYQYKDEAGLSGSIDNKLIKDNINFFRLAFLVGLGAEYSLGGNTNAYFSLNFNNGLTNIFRNQEYFTDKNGQKIFIDNNSKKANNNYFSLQLGILF